MKIYLVGGAVRDELLGLPVQERDWVVIGASVKEMQQKGFISVGKSFPVFLHPTTKEEYALGRLERKVAGGYQGFTFDTSHTVTLEEDLGRRDLTINAIAKAEDGTLIDPFDGIGDLARKILRHVSPAFVEDPVRVLRIARFAARFAAQGFQVAPETLALMQHMGEQGELAYLVPERVFKEMQRALSGHTPQVFFEVLTRAQVLPAIFPELVGGKYLVPLSAITLLSNAPCVRYAAMLVNMGAEGILLGKRLAVPGEYQQLAELVIRYHADCASAGADPERLLQLLEHTDAFRREARFRQFLEACQVGSVQCDHLLAALAAAKGVDIASILKVAQGKDIRAQVHAARKEAIAVIQNPPFIRGI